MPVPSSVCALVIALAVAAPVGNGGGRKPGELTLGPSTDGAVTVRDEAGEDVAAVDVRPGEEAVVNLPPGRYRVVDSAGKTVGEATVSSGRRVHADLPGDVPESKALAAAGAGVEAPHPMLPPSATAPARAPAHQGDARTKAARGSAKRWAAPLASALLPGLGQAINRQAGKSAVLFTGILGGTLGAVGLWRLRDADEGVSLSDAGPGRGGEVARLGALALLTSTVGLLYLGQILDAHAVARGRRAKPREQHDFSVELARFSTVGLSPGEPSYALYDDWNLSLMGQVRPRLTAGISDLGLKLGSDQLTLQGGLRVMGRLYDGSAARKRGQGPQRLWVLVGGGAFVQGTGRERSSRPLGADADDVDLETDRAFGAVGYAQAEVRYFLLDRWSLGVVPRISVPFTTRAYPRGRQLPRFATTFELGASVGVHL